MPRAMLRIRRHRPALTQLHPLRFGALLLLLGVTSACERTPESLPEWRAQDHDHQTQPNQAQMDPSAPAARPPVMDQLGISEVTLAAWKQNCSMCHGIIGRGDGPQGSMLKTPDLTRPSWQRVALDSEMEQTIRKGRGRMPAFGHLPDETIQGLIRLIRMMNAEPPAPAESGSQLPPGHPPTGSALPPGHPPTGAGTGSGSPLPPGHPPTGSQLPPGHPPTSSSAPAAPGSPH